MLKKYIKRCARIEGDILGQITGHVINSFVEGRRVEYLEGIKLV